MAKASIIIPTYKRKESLKATLRSLLKQEYDDFEIIIVDQDKLLDQELDKLFQDNKNRIRYFKHTGQSASSARNKGFMKARGGIVICCDDDIIAAPDLIKTHVDNYKDASIGAVSGRVLCANDLPFEKINGVGRLRKWDGKIIANFNADFKTEVEHAYGCNVSYRRELLIRVGGYDERLKGTGSFDDADVSFKIRKLGYKVVFEPRAEVKHVQARGGYRDLSFGEKMYWYYHNFMIFYLKHMKRIYLPIFLARQISGIFRRSILKKNLKVILLGTKGLIHGFGDYKSKT